MKIAMALFKYFPFGGLQRDFLRMAEECARRGHRVVAFTGSWSGDRPDWLEIRIIPLKSWTNPGTVLEFEAKFGKALARENFDVVVGFNRIAHLDFYFAADNCMHLADRFKHSELHIQLNPRYRIFHSQERKLLTPDSNTVIMYITPRQKQEYMAVYHTPENHFRYLPPGIDISRRRPANADQVRADKRRELGLNADDIMLILVGSDFRRKGGDRVVQAVAELPPELKKRTRVYLVGACPPGGCDILAEKLNLKDRVFLTGGRNDVSELLLAADLMVHPARDEATGTVLVEALAAGLPVLSTAVCGFSNYVADSGGMVIQEPFDQADMNKKLVTALESLSDLTAKALAYGAQADFYRRAEVAADLFEEKVESRHAAGKIAIALFKYFPYGGLQRDFLRIAEECVSRGHRVTAFTASWEGDRPDWLDIRIVPLKSLSNPRRALEFEGKFGEIVKQETFATVVGFNRMKFLDFYFAADNCIFLVDRTKHSEPYIRCRPRYQIFHRQERSVFEPSGNTRIMYISPRQKVDYMAVYHTQESRFYHLPPGIDRSYCRPDNADEIRAAKRLELRLNPDDVMLILVCTNYHLKGVDRVIAALGSLPAELFQKIRFYVVGDDKQEKYLRLASYINAGNRVQFMGSRSDVLELMLAADLMLHPARNEAAGTVLTEAIAVGLPVICSEICGFSNYVAESGGIVLPEPFDQEEFNRQLRDALSASRLDTLKKQAIKYGATADFYRRAEVAADLIEQKLR